MFVIHFFDGNVSRNNLLSLFLRKIEGLYFFPANWLLLIVIDGQIRPEKQLWILSHNNVYSEVLSWVVAYQQGLY